MKKKLSAMMIAIIMILVPAAAFAGTTEILKEQTSIQTELDISYNAGLVRDSHLYPIICYQNFYLPDDEGTCILNVKYARNEAIDDQEQDIDLDLTKEEAVITAVDYLKEQHLQFMAVPEYRFLEDYINPKTSVVKNDRGENYVRLDYETGENVIYLQPVRVNLWRIFTADKYMDQPDIEKLIFSYKDTPAVRDAISREMDEYGEKHIAEKTPFWTVFAILGIVLIGVITGLLINRRKRRIHRDMMEHPEKYMERQPKPGDKMITLTCKFCKKQYSIYVDPKDEAYVRKNRDRCPECQAAQRLKMEEMSGRTWYLHN